MTKLKEDNLAKDDKSRDENAKKAIEEHITKNQKNKKRLYKNYVQKRFFMI